MLIIESILVGGTILYLSQKKKKRINKALITKYQQNKTIALKKQKVTTEINKNIILSVATLGLTAVGSFIYPVVMLFAIPIIVYLNIPIIKRGYKELFHSKKIGAGVLDSVIGITMIVLQYFFASALFFTLYYISRKILLKTEDSSRKSLLNIWGETPKLVYIEKDGVEVSIAFEKIEVGDVIIAHAGEMIPVDGIIEKGLGNVDQHMLTGESQLVEKQAGDSVFASTLLLSGTLYIKVNTPGTETIAAKIKHILNHTTDYKSSLQARGEQIAENAALPTLALGLLTLPILGLQSAATILLSSFGAQMRIVAPISVLNYLKISSEENILIKDGRALEALGKIDTVVFDKTGTLTQEQPHVKNIYPCQNITENQVLTYAAAAEYKQKHPIALAILQKAQQRKLEIPKIDQSSYEMGYGIKVNIQDKKILVGSIRFMQLENIAISEYIETLQETIHSQGAALVYVACNNNLIGTIELQPTIRPEAKSIIEYLHDKNIKTVIISGDHQQPTAQLARTLNIDQYFANTLPENKAFLIEQLQKQGRKVCFIGDGINDAIALKKANVSISLQGASTIATDTAQIIFMDKTLNKLPKLFDLAEKLDKNLYRSFISAVIPGILCVGGVYFFHIGVITAGILYNISLGLGVTNAMLPKFLYKTKKYLDSGVKKPPKAGLNLDTTY